MIKIEYQFTLPIMNSDVYIINSMINDTYIAFRLCNQTQFIRFSFLPIHEVETRESFIAENFQSLSLLFSEA